MGDRADPRMRHVELLGVGFELGEEALEIVGREILARDDEDGLIDHEPDRREIGVGLVGKVRIDGDGRGVGSELPHLDGVAVGRGPHRPDRAGGAAGPHHVLDDDLLAERARHVLGDDARRDVGRTAGGERHDHRDRSRRKSLCRRRRDR